jgi:hypothetical protein
MSERIENIKKAVEKAAECRAVHLDSAIVTEAFQGQIVWKGVVEVFKLKGHPKAKRAYGWNIGEGADAIYTAVLEIPPVDSPSTAVRASLAAEARK